MKRKRILLILLCVSLIFGMVGLTGCGKGQGSDGPSIPEDQTYQITLFFANEKYIATGDESLEKFMVYQSELTSRPGDVYLDALELLKNPPEEGYGTVITDSIKFNDVYLKDGDTAVVDLDSNGLNGGSLDETFLISQIVDTLVNTFSEIKQVQFFVDGEAAESLMGHVDASEPFTKDLF